MLTEVKKHLDLLGNYFKLNLSASMEYRTSFIIQVIGMVLNNLSFAFFWWLLFERFQNIGGYGFRDVMLLWAVSTTGYGICFILFGNITRLVQIIVKGELDSYLLQPKNVLVNTVASRTVISAWGDFVYGIILFAILEGLNPGKWLLFLIFSITAALIFASVLITVGALAFWFGQVDALARLAFEFMITFTIYPEGIFDGFVKFVIFSVLPAGFVTMVPVRVLTAFNVQEFFLVFLAAGVWVTIAFTVFHRGLKRYESGNLMVQKM